MSLEQLTEDERSVVQACLRAACEGPFFPEGEFEQRFGQNRSDIDRVLRAWPQVDETAERVALAIINAMASLLSRRHAPPEERRRWLPVSDTEVLRVLHKWRGDPPAAPARLLQQLGGMMSALSKACYAADWLEGTEHMVPELCRRALESDAAQPWAQGEVTPGVARRLQELADQLGHWARPDDKGTGYAAFDPFPVPPRYAQELDFWKAKGGG